jgi:regulator of protease activity HflC (stomatin/prohibitin superfamily)
MLDSISAVTLAIHDMARAVRFYRMLGFGIVYGGEEAAFTASGPEGAISISSPSLPSELGRGLADWTEERNRPRPSSAAQRPLPDRPSETRRLLHNIWRSNMIRRNCRPISLHQNVHAVRRVSAASRRRLISPHSIRSRLNQNQRQQQKRQRRRHRQHRLRSRTLRNGARNRRTVKRRCAAISDHRRCSDNAARCGTHGSAIAA